jgi:hypothetical protein
LKVLKTVFDAQAGCFGYKNFVRMKILCPAVGYQFLTIILLVASLQCIKYDGGDDLAESLRGTEEA